MFQAQLHQPDTCLKCQRLRYLEVPQPAPSQGSPGVTSWIPLSRRTAFATIFTAVAGGGKAFNTCNEVSHLLTQTAQVLKYQVLLSASDLPEATNYWQKPSSSRSPALPRSLATPLPTLDRPEPTLQLEVQPQKQCFGLQKCIFPFKSAISVAPSYPSFITANLVAPARLRPRSPGPWYYPWMLRPWRTRLSQKWGAQLARIVRVTWWRTRGLYVFDWETGDKPWNSWQCWWETSDKPWDFI